LFINDHSISLTGWWFGTWILWLSIGNSINPADFHSIFQRGREKHQPALTEILRYTKYIYYINHILIIVVGCWYDITMVVFHPPLIPRWFFGTAAIRTTPRRLPRLSWTAGRGTVFSGDLLVGDSIQNHGEIFHGQIPNNGIVLPWSNTMVVWLGTWITGITWIGVIPITPFFFARELWWVSQMNMGKMDENGWTWGISPWISWDFNGIWWEYVW
jgi:hypothetical protein